MLHQLSLNFKAISPETIVEVVVHYSDRVQARELTAQSQYTMQKKLLNNIYNI